MKTPELKEGDPIEVTLRVKYHKTDEDEGGLYITPATNPGYIRYLHPHLIIKVRKVKRRGLRKSRKG